MTGAGARVRALAADLGERIAVGDEREPIQFCVPSWCHSSNEKKSLSIGSHDADRVASSDGFPLITCHVGCDYPKVRNALIARGARPELLRPAHTAPSTLEGSGAAPTVRPAPLLPFVPNNVWLSLHDALLANTKQLAFLMDDKGLTLETVRAMSLGWDKRTQRISIPVFDDDGRCLNLRLYLPHAGLDEHKITSFSVVGGLSYGRNRLFVPGEFLDPARTTLHCAGELDAILGWQHGWQTTTQTGGEGSQFPALDLDRMRGQTVVIAYDNDEAGRKGATKAAKTLLRVAASVRVADLGSLDVGEKGDLGDVWLRDDLGIAAVRQLVAEATPWVKGGEAGNGWLSQDLTTVLDGSYEPLQPTVCRRSGSGPALFYPGKTHALIAESEAGKTWLALLAVRQEIEQGHHAFFYDFEDDAVAVVGRLQEMGTDVAALQTRFHYVRPDGPLTEELRTDWLAQHSRLLPTLVVVDGVTEAMTHHGWGQNDNGDIAKFYRTILTPMADYGAAVVALDHLPKYDEKGRGAIGGVHKLNGIDGAVYRLKSVRELMPGRMGLSAVTVDKDRPGQVKRHMGPNKRIADLIVDSEGDDLTVDLEAPGSVITREAVARPAKKIAGKGAEVLAALDVADERTVTQLVGLTKASSSSVKNWVKDFEAMGYATKREAVEAGKKVHYWTRVQPPGEAR